MCVCVRFCMRQSSHRRRLYPILTVLEFEILFIATTIDHQHTYTFSIKLGHIFFWFFHIKQHIYLYNDDDGRSLVDIALWSMVW